MKKTNARLFSVFTIAALAACGSDDDNGGGGFGPGFRLGNGNLNFKNQANEKQFFKKFGEVKKLTKEIEKPVNSFGRSSNRNLDDRVPMSPARSALALLADEVQTDSPMALFDSEEPEQGGTDFFTGESLESANDCSDAMKDVRKSYSENLEQLKLQFESLEGIEKQLKKSEDGEETEEEEDNSSENDSADDGSDFWSDEEDVDLQPGYSAGSNPSGGEMDLNLSEQEFKLEKVENSDAALAYTFETEGSPFGKVSGEVSGSADDTQVRIDMTLDSDQSSPSEEKETEDNDNGFGSGFGSGFGEDFDSIEIPEFKMSMTSMSYANLETKLLQADYKLKLIQGESAVSMDGKTAISGGEQAGIEYRLNVKMTGEQLESPMNFDVSMAALVESENELSISIQTSSQGNSELPNMKAKYLLTIDDDGTCNISTASN